jgi:hypothetical protein
VTKREMERRRDKLLEDAKERSRWVYLNPQNADVWRADVAKLRALAAAIEVDIQLGNYTRARSRMEG